MWTVTCGHPGGALALLQVLADAEETRGYRKEDIEVPLETGLILLDDLSRLFTALQYTGFNRSLPRDDIIKSSPDLSLFLQEVLAADAFEGDPEKNAQLKVLLLKRMVACRGDSKD